jgi:hypothetical protein
MFWPGTVCVAAAVSSFPLFVFVYFGFGLVVFFPGR